MTNSDTTNGQFLSLVKERAADARKQHDTFALAFALARGKRFVPMSCDQGIAKALLEIMRHDGSAAKRARAAIFYLDGKDRHWAIDPRDERDARALAAKQHERQPAMLKSTQPKIKAKSKPRANADEKEKLKRNLAIARECAVLEYAMKHGSNEEKLDAIHAWFVAMEYLAPEKLRRPLINAKEAANVSS